MPLNIRKAGVTYAIPMYTSKTAGNFLNGDEHLAVVKSGTTYYVNFYSIGSIYAKYPLFIRSGGVTYQAGPAYEVTNTDVITRTTAGTSTWTVPSDDAEYYLDQVELYGGGGAGNIPGNDYTMQGTGTFTWYAGGGGGGGAGYYTIATNISYLLTAGTVLSGIVGAGGVRGVSNGGASSFKRGSIEVYTASGAQNGFRGGNASSGNYGIGGNGGTGRINGTKGANGTSAGVGANGAGASATYGGGGTGTNNGNPGYARIRVQRVGPKAGV